MLRQQYNQPAVLCVVQQRLSFDVLANLDVPLVQRPKRSNPFSRLWSTCDCSDNQNEDAAKDIGNGRIGENARSEKANPIAYYTESAQFVLIIQSDRRKRF